MAVEILLLLVYVYVPGNLTRRLPLTLGPGVNDFLEGAPAPWYCWAIVGAFGLFIFAYNELRKYCIRRWPDNPVVNCFSF